MTAQQWKEVKDRFHEALRESAQSRRLFLLQACSGDVVRIEVERLLAEHELAGSFLSRPVTMPSALFATSSAGFREEFHVNARFAVLGRLGAGTFGEVYRVFDKERNARVALKRLLHFNPAHLGRFKHEFRSLVDLAHPNLVKLYQLFGEDHQWFFTMELVEGVDFLAYTRSGNLAGNTDCLREVLFQLATGVRALHSAGRLHRDLKPSNVLVTPEGRVVILDFGLVKELTGPEVEQSLPLVGSPAYMAPEQAAGSAINEAADWYAVGVMLYKALTGQLPFAGTWTEILERKQKDDAPRSRDLAPDVPEDLDEACHWLLERRPEVRANGIPTLLAQSRRKTRRENYSEENFVGRVRELELLQERFAALSSGKRQIVLLSGRSGIGKSSLISHFLSRLSREHPATVILKSRCRESEAVPFKAIDPIADELVRYLGSLEESGAMALLPRRPELLKRLFPVFGELRTISTFPDRPLPDLEEHGVRRRAFDALCELLGRMTDRNPVVISIDDLQWCGDLDSISFLAELVVPPSAPALMLIMSVRSEDADRSAPILILRGFQEKFKETEPWLDLNIEGLSEKEGRDLLRLLNRKTDSLTEEQSRRILYESCGNPLLISELLRFATRERGAEIDRPASGVMISEMIRERVANLSSTARELLEVLAVAGEPVSSSMLYRAVKVSGEDPAHQTGVLIREHLVRFTGGPQGEQLEPFHDQVREAALAWLSFEELRRLHSRLAELLETGEDPDQGRLLRHYRGAGNLRAALSAALSAAKTSESSLAFEQAAQFYAEALETGEASEAIQATLLRRRAEALAKAGRGYESGQCYIEAVRWPAYNDALEMQQLAAEQFMRSGYLDEGIRISASLLRTVGLRMPEKPLESVFRMLALRAFIRVRGLRWRERAEQKLSSSALRKLDVLWNSALGLSAGNPIFGNYLQARHMLEALRAGEPFRLALSVGLGAFYESLGGTREYKRGRQLVDFALNLSERLNDPYVSAMVYTNWAGVDLLCGRIEDGLGHLRTAEHYWDQAGRRGRTWEISTSNTLHIWFLGWGGRIRELSQIVPTILKEGRSRGDLFAAVAIRCFTTAHLADLARDEPYQAIREIADAMQYWRKTSYDMQHFGATFAYVECHLYSGRTKEARERLISDESAIRESLLFRKSQIFKTILLFAQGRSSLGEWLQKPTSRELQTEVEQYATRLGNLSSPWADAMRNLLRAGLMVGLDRRNDALLLLASSEKILREQDLRLLAAAVLRRRGELEGHAGVERVKTADAFMSSENILRPDRITAMFLPGNWLGSAPA
jgi:eukaryotic-like serine/threonine-protein kinase